MSTARPPGETATNTKGARQQPACPASLGEAHGYCAALVRQADHDRYIATLYAPEAARSGLFALYAFSHEVARIRESVTEPLPGEVRMQWWRDLLEGEARGEAQAHPVAAALLDTIARHDLPRAAFGNLIEARTFDLYDDPMPSLRDLDGYCGETAGALFRLACLVLAGGRDPGGAEACGHAGIAHALTGLMRAFPWHAARGQIYLPADILARNGVTRDDIVRGRGGPGLAYTLRDMRALARGRMERFAKARRGLPAGLTPAFLPLALVEPYLGLMDERRYDPYRTMITLPAWRRQWAIWRMARG